MLFAIQIILTISAFLGLIHIYNISEALGFSVLFTMITIGIILLVWSIPMVGILVSVSLGLLGKIMRLGEEL